MNHMQEYKQKLLTPDQAAMLVKDGDWVDFSMIFNTPELMDVALSRRVGDLRDVKVRGGMALHPIQIVQADPERRSFTYNSWHFSALERKYHDMGLCDYIPMNYRFQSSFYRNYLDVDVACISVTPMDRNGFFNFSLTNSSARTILDKAQRIILEVNENLPWACGGFDECVHISEVDAVVEGPHQPLAELEQEAESETDRKIATLICEQIQSGSVLQLGIGSLPNLVGKMLAASDIKDLGMHTEMLCDAYLDIHEAGKLTNRKKLFDRNKGVFSFCLGSRALYDWVDDNPGLASCPVDYTNSLDVITKHENMIAINNCVEVDLYGQTCSESSGTRQISGTGGQLDFLTGSYMSRGGKGFICMSSTYTDKKTGQINSRIVPTLPAGSVVTDPRSQAFYLVTEWGMVNLAGCSVWERAEQIISIAHPAFRDELIRAAEKMKIWRKGNYTTS